jgi:hypothetical protein
MTELRGMWRNFVVASLCALPAVTDRKQTRSYSYILTVVGYRHMVWLAQMLL